jgi:hypothetical protein
VAVRFACQGGAERCAGGKTGDVLVVGAAEQQREHVGGLALIDGAPQPLCVVEQVGVEIAARPAEHDGLL